MKKAKKHIKLAKIYIGLLIMLAYTTLGVTQSSDPIIDILSVRHGVSGLDVENFFLDKDQTIWLSTSTGLNICYANNVENIYFGQADNQIHSKKSIIQLMDLDTHIDLFYKDEHTFYDQYDKKMETFKKIKTDSIKSDFPKTYISTIKAENNIYFVSQQDNQLFITDVYHHKRTIIKLLDGININKIIKSMDGYYMMDQDENVYNYTNSNGLVKLNKPIIPGYKQFKIKDKTIIQKKQIFHLDKQGRLWVSYKTFPGVFLLHQEDNTIRLYEALATKELFTWVSEDDTGKLIFASTDKYRFTRAFYLLNNDNKLIKWNKLSHITSLPRKIISKDFYKEIFISTYRNLIILNFDTFDFISTSFNENSEQSIVGSYANLIWGISKISKDSIFITSEYPHWGIYNAKKGVQLSRFDSNKDTMLFQNVYSKSEKTVWTTVFNREKQIKHELYVIYPMGKASEQKISKFPFEQTVTSIAIDTNDVIYCGHTTTDGSYAISFHKPFDSSFTSLINIPYKPNYMNYEASSHSLWCIDMDQGVFHIDLKHLDSKITILDIQKRQNTSFYSVNLGTKNRLYISTSDGMYIWDIKEQKLISHLGVEEGLSANSVCATVEDKRGNLWISTFSGINYYDFNTDYISQYHTEQGIPDDEFNTKSYHKDDYDNIYFGSANGMVKIDINRFYQKKFSISSKRLIIEDNNQSTTTPYIPIKNIRLHKDKNTKLELSLSTNYWSNRDQIQYLQYLSPIDHRWTPVTIKDKLRFKNLNPGNYQLKLKAVTTSGLSSNTLTLSFNVYKYWYEKAWVLSTFALFLLGLMIFGVWYYFDRDNIRKNNTKMRFDKRISELELKILQSQLNPHFVFNSINAIQSSMDNEKKELVSQYLNDFAGLMRLVLDSSRTKNISLEREIRLLQLYLNLENLRFGDTMDFNIEVDPNIDLKFIKIPTMILQPFVENAINHGLFHKKGKGKLRITIKEENNIIQVVIKDNGIGRKKAMEIRKNSLKNYKSTALKIIEERLEILKQTHNYQISIEIKDLYDSEGLASGTAVYVAFPGA